MTKTKALGILQALPDDFQLEDFFERLLFVQQVEDRIALSDQPGNSVSFEEAMRIATAQPAAHAA